VVVVVCVVWCGVCGVVRCVSVEVWCSVCVWRCVVEWVLWPYSSVCTRKYSCRILVVCTDSVSRAPRRARSHPPRTPAPSRPRALPLCPHPNFTPLLWLQPLTLTLIWGVLLLVWSLSLLRRRGACAGRLPKRPQATHQMEEAWCVALFAPLVT
jgi:hypothetical protein